MTDLKILETLEFLRDAEAAVLEHSTHSEGMEYFIEGGCVRDMLLGRPVKDIDVVFKSPKDWKGIEWKRYNPGDLKHDEGGVFAVGRGGTFRGHPIQFIGRHCPMDPDVMVDFHALALSNVFYRKGSLSVHGTFLKDVRDQAHTVKKGNWRAETLDRYIRRVLKKYPWPVRYLHEVNK